MRRGRRRQFQFKILPLGKGRANLAVAELESHQHLRLEMDVSDRIHLFATSVMFGILCCGCDAPPAAKPAPAAAKPTHKYPAQWWAAAPKEGAPEWEILPQEAQPGEVILSKRDKDLGLLSNFAATPFEYHGERYDSLEGFWQMMKYPEGPDDPRSKFPGLEWKLSRRAVAELTGFAAKRAGDVGSRNMAKMGIDWVSFEGKQFPYTPAEPGDHFRLIEESTWAKVRQNPDVKRVLLATGDLILKPDHHQEKDAPAAWRYYDILMKIRGELQSEAAEPTKPDNQPTPN
jgi:predicted NAD-dependent protein-ADP-ribosyltransferase YbiA (DUF1768 family)